MRQQAIDRVVDACYSTRRRIRLALPPMRRRDEERWEDHRRAFNAGRDCERRELGLPPKYSEYFIEEPPRLRAVSGRSI
jgi:hypothetical protein